MEAAARDVQAKGQAATLEQQRLTARLGGSCRAHLKPARKSSTPAVVPGAAPALAKAGVGGLINHSVHVAVNISILRACEGTLTPPKPTHQYPWSVTVEYPHDAHGGRSVRNAPF